MNKDILNNLGQDQIWVCETCGDPDVEARQWVNINTNEIGDGTDDGEYFCNRCNEIITTVIIQEDFIARQQNCLKNS